MKGILLSVLKWAMGGLIARMLVGAGLTLVGYVSFVPLVMTGLNQLNSALGGLPADMLQVLLLGGLGEVLSIIGSAMLTRVSLLAGLAGLARVASTGQGT